MGAQQRVSKKAVGEEEAAAPAQQHENEDGVADDHRCFSLRSFLACSNRSSSRSSSCWPSRAKVENSTSFGSPVSENGGHSAPPQEQIMEATNPSAMSKVEEGLIVASQLRRFSFSDLKAATRNFRPDSLLGQGGFGCVFKGWIEEHGTAPVKAGTGLTVAVKILNHNGLQGHKEWLAEITFLGQLYHPHLVKLIGYCIEGDQRLLVYEFMQRGSLENHLFRKGSLPLPWTIRMKIALGAAKGLEFLHTGYKPVIYRDFKTSNILLDLAYNAKLSDFGLAKDGPQGDKTHISTRVMGTHGYAAPEYVMTGHLTAKSDVYSFGVVLLEMLTGRRSMDKSRPSGEHNLVEWVRPFFNDRRKMLRVLDPRLEGRISVKGAQQACQLAHRCLSRDPKGRPSMKDIVDILSQIHNSKDKANATQSLHGVPCEGTRASAFVSWNGAAEHR